MNGWMEVLQQRCKPTRTTLDAVGFNQLDIGVLVDINSIWYPNLHSMIQ